MRDQEQAADVEKENGNKAYKEKRFKDAITHYDRAIELNDKIAYYTNKAAAYLELGEYEKCIQVCLEGIDVERNSSPDAPDNQAIAKAYGRVGKAHYKMENNKKAKEYAEKSLKLCSDPSIVKLLADIVGSEKAKAPSVATSEAKQNPAAAVNDKLQADKYYYTGQFPMAIKYYTEALKKDPNNAIIYSNRALCFFKLKEYNLSLSDAEECVKNNSTFLKGYLHKGKACLELKEFARAMMAFEKALSLDKDSEVAKEGYKKACEHFYDNPCEIRKRALEDPEIREILADPEIRSILEKLVQNPKEAAKHLKTPHVLEKMEKLVTAGVLRLV